MPVLLFAATGGKLLFGGAKPVPVNPRNYRRYKRGDIIVSMAGILTNLALFILCLLGSIAVGLAATAVPMGSVVLGAIQRMLFWGVWLNLLLAFFNLIPIPPLDGSHVVVHLLPPQFATRYRELSRYGFAALLVLVLFLPRALLVLLAPAFALQGMACDLAAPYTLQEFPLCLL